MSPREPQKKAHQVQYRQIINIISYIYCFFRLEAALSHFLPQGSRFVVNCLQNRNFQFCARMVTTGFLS